jgi:hypothetical protein
MNDGTKLTNDKPRETLSFSYDNTTEVYTVVCRNEKGNVTGIIEGRLRKSDEAEKSE